MICHRTSSPALLLGALVLLTGCGGGDSREPASTRSASAASGELDRCTLLQAKEIEGAIGPHGGGSSDLSNTWGTQSCRWTATKAQPVEGYPDGWHDAIEVGVIDANVTPMMRQQVTGDPVSGFVAGARYDNSYGDLWFDCPGGRLCVVKAHTASGDRRQEIAMQLARLVNSRLR